jgi:hypothetical protein
MRAMLLGAAALVLSATMFASGPALADDTASDPMTGYYGNTVVVIDAKGLESHTYYNADHSFSGVAPAYSYHYQGTWEVKDGQLCRTFNPEPMGITNPNCEPIQPHVVGDSWTSPDGGKGSVVVGVN